MRTIVVGVDGSDGAAHALRWACAEGALRGSEVRAVLAWGFLDQHHTVVGEPFDPGYTAADAKQALDSYVEAAVGAQASASVERVIVVELPARALLEASGGAELLVVGARGLGGFPGLLLGSVSQKCLHEATCPVAVIRSDEVSAPTDVPPRVVVGIDGSQSSKRALMWAADEARARTAVLEVLHAWQPPLMGGFPFGAVTVDFSMFEDAAHQLMATTLEEVDLSGMPGPIERSIVCSGASAALLEAGQRAQVVVLGTRGIDGLKRVLLGSVSHQVTLHATRPVVVVPLPPTD